MCTGFARNGIIAALTGLAALTLAGPAAAQAVKAFQLVGFTSATRNGGKGVVDFTRTCQLEFEASRMCTSTEVMQTVDFPELTSNAWVRPVFSPLTGGATNLTVLDASGVMSGDDGDLSCSGWRRNASDASGLTVDKDGLFEARACNEGRRIACCALIPVPEPSMSMLQGAAATTLAATSILKGRP
ncbi:MAG: hypothetical protein QNK03_10645 [Myxococcota bacterium]|nr:hypothetical protein [Myxococcota bacterium]